jgi:hypothetical protein
MSFNGETTARAPNPVILNTTDVGTATAGGTLDVTVTLEERGSTGGSGQDACGSNGTKLDLIAEQVNPYKQLTPDDEGVICLEAGETRDVTFSVPVPEQPGEFYDFKISAYGDDTGTFYASTDVLTMAIEAGEQQPDPGNGGGGGLDQQTLLLAGGGLAALAVLFLVMQD